MHLTFHFQTSINAHGVLQNSFNAYTTYVSFFSLQNKFRVRKLSCFKRCSCPFGMIIWDVNLGRCHKNLGWKFIIIYFFNWQTEKKPVLDQSEVCLPKYHNKFSWHRPKLTSQIIVPNGHEHLFCESHKTCSCPLVQYFGTLFWDDITIF